MLCLARRSRLPANCEEDVQQVRAEDGSNMPEDVEGHAAHRTAEKVWEQCGAVVHLPHPKHGSDNHVVSERAEKQELAELALLWIFSGKGK